MSTQNNAAQAAAQILTYLGFAQAVSKEPAADPRRDHIQALIESALLSKLRAPVAPKAKQCVACEGAPSGDNVPCAVCGAEPAPPASENPLSDEYVNAVIRRHGYDSPECVIARLHQWIGLHGGENGVTLLMYEAHKALVKLRTPVADERAAFTAWLAGSYPSAYSEPEAVRLWHHRHVAALAWQERGRRAALASAPAADERAGTVNSEPLPVVARLYYTGSPHRRYRRASTQAGPGEPLCFVSVAEAWLRRKDARIVALEKELALLQASAPVAGEAQPTWDDLKSLAVKHSVWVPGYGPFAAELLATYGLAPAEQPHWLAAWLNAMNHVAPQASPAADGRDAKDAARKSAGNIQEPMNGDGWHVVWWNESMRLVLPDGSRLDRFQGYRNGTMQLTIKADAAIAAQQGEGGGV